MTTARRILDAVTLRRVVAALLIGGFTKEIISFLTWLADTGWELKDLATARASRWPRCSSPSTRR